MKKRQAKQSKKQGEWPRPVRFGRTTVTVYRRVNGSGNFNFMVVNTSEGNRRLDSYAKEDKALDAALELAKRLNSRDVIGASMTKEQAVDYASAAQGLAPFNVSLSSQAQFRLYTLCTIGNSPKQLGMRQIGRRSDLHQPERTNL